MAREDVGKALEALNDDDLRQAVADGNFDGMGDLDLTDDERSLVVGAANDYPEVSGFSFTFGMPRSFDPSATDRFSQAANYAFGQRLDTGNIGTHLVM